MQRSVSEALQEGAAGDVDAIRRLRDNPKVPWPLRCDLAKVALLHSAGNPYQAAAPVARKPLSPAVSLAPPPLAAPEKTG